MLAEAICGVIVLASCWYGARLGLGKVAQQVIASALGLGLSTYLAPIIAAAMQNWLPFALVWFVASVLIFFLVAILAHRALGLFLQAAQAPRWLSVGGGGVLMGCIGALGAGFILWTVQFSTSLRAFNAAQPVTPASGIYRWASVELELMTRWSLVASGVKKPIAASLGKLAAEPGLIMQQVADLAMSPELKVFWEDPQAQDLMINEDDNGLLLLASGQQLLAVPSAVAILSALPEEENFGKLQLIKQVRTFWSAKKNLLEDEGIKSLLADGTLVEQLGRRDMLSLYLNPNFRPLVERIKNVLSQPPQIKAPPMAADSPIQPKI